MDPEVVPDYPASPVGAPTGLEEDFSPAAVVATETPHLPDEGFSGNTATTQIGTTGEEEPHTGAPGMTAEARRGGGQAGPGRELEVVMTCWRSCTAERLRWGGAILLLDAAKDRGARMRRRAGGRKEGKGRIGRRNHRATHPSRASLDRVTSGGTTTACL